MSIYRALVLVVVMACGGAPAPSSPSPSPSSGSSHARTGAFDVEVSGRGPPVILIPGLASSGETWTTTVAHLRERYTCHVVTLAGFAGVPPIGEPLLPAVEAGLVRYIAAQRMERPVVIGHSLGGSLALMLASDHPQLMGPVVIVDSLPFMAANMGVQTLEQAAPMLEGMRAMMTAPTDEQHAAQTRSGAWTNRMATKPADQQRIITWGLASDRTAVREAMLALLATDLRPQLSRVTSPILVIGAGAAWAPRETTVKVTREQYANAPRLHYTVVDNARHFVMLDELPVFLSALDRFLADPDAAVRDRGLATL